MIPSVPSENTEEESPPTFTSLPVEIATNILDRLHFIDLCSMRKVNVSIRQLIIDSKIAPNLESIRISGPNVTVSVDGAPNFPNRIFYRDGENGQGCIVSNGWTEKRIHLEEPSLEAFFADFEESLKGMKQLNQFVLKDKTDYGQSQFGRIAKTLAERQTRIEVQDLQVSSMDEGAILSVLQHMDPNALKNLKIMNTSKTTHSINLDKIADTVQWSHCKSIFVKRCVVPRTWNYFRHLSKITIESMPLDPRVSIVFKNMCLENAEDVWLIDIDWGVPINNLPIFAGQNYTGRLGFSHVRYWFAHPVREGFLVGANSVPSGPWREIYMTKFRGDQIRRGAFAAAAREIRQLF